ncbi:MAG: hypothetical protein PHI16_01905 [Methanocellales archaeon]|nr:hypothetical protein [Methanocellales archaeon]
MKDEAKKEVKEVKRGNDIDGRICALERIVGKLKTWLENMHGADIDGDGKIGKASIGAMLITAWVSLVAGVLPVFAAEEILARWDAPEGTDAVIEINADERDDAGDVGEIIMTTGGTMKIDVGGTTAATFSSAGMTADLILADGVATIDSATSNGTVRTGVKIVPAATADTPTWVTRWVGLGVNEVSGSTAVGFADTNTAGYGFLTSWGRTAVAASNWDGVSETPFETRMINKLTNDAAYKMAGGHIKAKNYSTGTVGDIRGLWIEAVDDGTVTTSSGLYISTDSSEINYLIDMNEASTPATADIRFSNGAIIKNGDANTLTITEATVAVSGAFDADSVTVNAGAGIDNQAAGTLVVGASTATKVEIADTGVETEVQGDLDVQASAHIVGSITNDALTASLPVFTDANKGLVSTGTVPVNRGGSGAATLANHGVLVGSDTDAITVLTVGTDNQVLRGATGADPAFGALVDADVPDTITLNGATVAGKSLTSSGIGAAVAGIASAVEYGDGIQHETVITLTNVSLVIADGAFDDGEKVYDFPEGRILVQGVTASLVSTITTNFNASAADTFVVGAGTTTTSVSGDGALQTTEIDILPSTENDTVDGTTTVFTNGIALAASAHFDGTTTAKDVFVNMGIPAANDSGANTNAVTGTIRITWLNLGDY